MFVVYFNRDFSDKIVINDTTFYNLRSLSTYEQTTFESTEQSSLYLFLVIYLLIQIIIDKFNITEQKRDLEQEFRYSQVCRTIPETIVVMCK